MLRQPENNIKFTDDQIAQLEEAKSRLFSLEEEIALREKRLVFVKGEVLKTIKELEYTTELFETKKAELASLSIEVQSMQSSKSSLTEDVQNLSSTKEAHAREMVSLKAELSARETSRIEKEKAFQAELSALTGEKADLISKKEKLDKAESKLKAALNELWK